MNPQTPYSDPARPIGDGHAARHDGLHAEPLHGDAGRRPISSLFSDLWRETTTLVHEEAELAKADLADKVSEATHAASGLAIGGGLAFAGALLLLMAASNALALALPADIAPWLAPLIVGGVVLLIGLIALSSARSRLQARHLKPRRTMDSLNRDRHLVNHHMSHLAGHRHPDSKEYLQ